MLLMKSIFAVAGSLVDPRSFARWLFLDLGTQLGVEGRIEAMTLSFFGGGGQNYGNPNL